MIPYGRQDITEKDIAAVEAVLKSDFITKVPSFLDSKRRSHRSAGPRKQWP